MEINAHNALIVFVIITVILTLVLAWLIPAFNERGVTIDRQNTWLAEHDDFLKTFVPHEIVFARMTELATKVANAQGMRVGVQLNADSSDEDKRLADELANKTYDEYELANQLAYHVRGGSLPWKKRLKANAPENKFRTTTGVLITLNLSKSERRAMNQKPFQRRLKLDSVEEAV